MNENHDSKTGEFTTGGGGMSKKEQNRERLRQDAANSAKFKEHYQRHIKAGMQPADAHAAAHADLKASHTQMDNRSTEAHAHTNQPQLNAHGQTPKTAASVRHDIRTARKMQWNVPPSQRRSVP